MNKPSTLGGGILLAVAAGYGYMITTLPNRNLANTMGAAFMPIVFDVALAILAAVLIVQGLRGAGRRTGEQRVVPLTVREILGIVVVFAVFFAYIFLIDILGFLVVTPVFLLVLLLLQGIRRPLRIIAVCVGVTVGVYLLFRYGFNVQITGFALL